jgi:hypothetical protein
MNVYRQSACIDRDSADLCPAFRSYTERLSSVVLYFLARRRLRPARGIRQFDRAGCRTAGFSRLAYGGTEDLMTGRMRWRDQHTAFAFSLGRACEGNSF